MRRKFRWLWACLGLALAVGLGLSLTTAVLKSAEAATAGLGIGWVPYAIGLTEPVDIAFTGVPTDTRMFVVERAGKIKVVLSNGTVQTTPFLSITTKVDDHYGEMGLLGLAFDPDFANNGFFYIYYNDMGGDIQLSRFQVSVDPNIALTTEVKILHISHPGADNHNGGDLNFGPDGYLYLAPGDGADSNNAQLLNTLLGKVLRINVGGAFTSTYTIPAGNPYTQTAGAKPEIWALGLRNPWRFSFDQLTGEMYLADVGQESYEEVNRRPAASPGGENYGWPCYEGLHEINPGCPMTSTMIVPIYEYNHGDDDGVAVTGGFVYRGGAYPSLNGFYFFADYGSRQFYAINTANNVPVDLGQMLTGGANPSSFGQDPQGELYVADLNSGKIYKLTGPPPQPMQTPSFIPLILR